MLHFIRKKINVFFQNHGLFSLVKPFFPEKINNPNFLKKNPGRKDFYRESVSLILYICLFYN